MNNPELEQLLAAVEGRIDRERGVAAWLRSRPTRLRALLAALTALMLIAFSGWAGACFVVVGLHKQLAFCLYALALAAVLFELMRPIHLEERSALQRALGRIALAAPAVVPLLGLALPHGDAAHSLPGCLRIGVLVALSLLAMLRALDRAAHAGRDAAILAVGAASIAGNLALLLYCPASDIDHVLRWHAPVGLLLFVAYIVLRRRPSASRR